jgi:phosphatidylinositol dimannoside acyltransferase
MDTYLAWRALGAVAPSLPLDWGHAVARRLADLVYRRNVQAVRGLRANISHAMGASAPAARVDGAVRQAYRTLFSNYFDLFRLPALSVEQLRSLVPLTGWEIVQAARALGRGVILCSAHLGHIEAALQIVTMNGLPTLGPAEHIQPERLYRYIVSLRTRHGMRLIPTDGPMLELFRTLRRGEAVALALDRDVTGTGVQTTVCGKPAHVPDGYARVAARTGSPIVIGFCYRERSGRVWAELGPSFVPDPLADREKTYRAALDFGVRALERAITAHPEQWVLTTPLWKVNIEP